MNFEQFGWLNLIGFNCFEVEIKHNDHWVISLKENSKQYNELRYFIVKMGAKRIRHTFFNLEKIFP